VMITWLISRPIEEGGFCKDGTWYEVTMYSFFENSMHRELDQGMKMTDSFRSSTFKIEKSSHSPSRWTFRR
jgi:hypothetical protein